MAYFPLLHLPAFLIGAAAGTLFQRNQRFHLQSLSTIQKTLFEAGLVLFCGTLLILNPFSSLLGQAVMLPFVTLAIFSLASGGSLFARFLGWSPIVLLGEISYAIYILQLPVYYYLRGFLAATGLSRYGTTFSTVVYLISIIGVSLLSYYFVETPVRRKIVQTKPVKPAHRLTSPASQSPNNRVLP